MNVKAKISFTGAISMRQGEERELQEESTTLHDLLEAGYVVGVELARGPDMTAMLGGMAAAQAITAEGTGMAAGTGLQGETAPQPSANADDAHTSANADDAHTSAEAAPAQNVDAETPARARRTRRAAENEAERGNAGDSGTVRENG